MEEGREGGQGRGERFEGGIGNVFVLYLYISNDKNDHTHF